MPTCSCPAIACAWASRSSCSPSARPRATRIWVNRLGRLNSHRMSRLLFRDAQGRHGGTDRRAQPAYIGRGVDAAIRTDDPMVSRKHSLVVYQDGRYWIEDLDSSNGTHVNDVRVKRQALAHNDVVRCGSLWLRFVEDAP